MHKCVYVFVHVHVWYSYYNKSFLRCTFCEKVTVPLLTINIYDMRHEPRPNKQAEEASEAGKSTTGKPDKTLFKWDISVQNVFLIFTPLKDTGIHAAYPLPVICSNLWICVQYILDHIFGMFWYFMDKVEPKWCILDHIFGMFWYFIDMVEPK